MSSELNSFNVIAGVYDKLARIVFGKAIVDAQLFYLRKISECKNVLIIGGGTGLVALRVLEMYPQTTITYVEASEKMIALTKNKVNQFSGRITFIHGTEKSIPSSNFYDGVITHFFLDLFPDKELTEVIRSIKEKTRNALWLVTDFESEGRRWQRLLLWTMYGFFRITAGVQAKSLPAWRIALQKAGISELENRRFYSGFIVAGLFRVNG
jgi:tRNA (cmo5U34)-methyltransferase